MYHVFVTTGTIYIIPLGIALHSGRAPALWLSAMDLSQILTAANVNPGQADQLIQDGWTAEHFALIADSVEDFDAAINEIFPEDKSLLERASLRLAWKRCQQPVGSSSAMASEGPVASAASASNSWSETFAPKLTQSVVSQLKATFKTHYPAEVLLPENTPSLRLLSTIVHQKSKLDYKWIPWKYRLSVAKSDEITASKSTKLAKSEGLNLHSMLLDDPPALEVSNGGMGLHALRQMFETFAIAMAMAEVAHLSSLKQYYLKFLQMMTNKLDQDTGLRNATILEAQAADKALMTIAAELVLERKWSWDDALYEVTYIRADMMSLLQPRPRLPKTYQPQRSEASGKGSFGSPLRPAPYQKGNNKGNKGKSKGKVAWVTEAHIKGEKRQLCMRFQSNKCTLGDSCKFTHACAYPVGDGQACGKAHGALQHASTPH